MNRIAIRTRVFQIIKERSFRFGDFTLASGEKSKYYLDMKPTMFDPEGASLLAQLIFLRVAELQADYIGGLEMGAVPLIAPINMLSYQSARPLPGFFVRKGAKDHGTKKLVEVLEGDLRGKNVVILEDVTTKGESAMQAVAASRDVGANVILVLSIVDREAGASDLFEGSGIPFECFFRASEFLASV
ncbi:MAG: orotate phosphoribosyltransferase [Xanthobacteraceae bacterium]|jgi:orotate phosphoribosyltransferase